MSKTQVPVFKNSNDLYEAIGFPHRSHIPNFDIHAIDELEPSSSRCMPPYRQDFFQIALLTYVGRLVRVRRTSIMVYSTRTSSLLG